MGFFYRVSVFLTETIILFTVIAFIPGLPPDGQFELVENEPTQPLEGPLAPNTRLDSAVRLFENKFIAPESVASRGRENEIFVSMHGGSIVKVYAKNYAAFKEITKIGPGCNAPYEERICGRPLGLRFAKDGQLLVADAYLGIFKVDVDTGAKERLLDAALPIAGARPLLVDDLDEDEQGNIYWSDASSRSDLSEGILEMFIGPSGRLFKMDAKTGQSLLLIDGLFFPNGVQLSPNEDFVLVCETFKSRVLRYWLKGAKAGTYDVFVSGLPGFPDNIRPHPKGGYYVSLVSVKDPNVPDAFTVFGRLPWLRRLLARLLYGTKKLFDAITYVYDNQVTPRIAYAILSTGSHVNMMSGNRSMVVVLDESGKVTSSLRGDSGAVRFISETTHVGDKLFFGSPYNHYLGMLTLEGDEVVDLPPQPKAQDLPPQPKTEDLPPQPKAQGDGKKKPAKKNEKDEL